jgi:glucose/arabinose dehydrogenase
MDSIPGQSLWTNDNQVDGMGDEQPPGELNRISNAGQDFGFPWYGAVVRAPLNTRTIPRPPMWFP